MQAWRMFCINAFWLAYSAFWFIIVVVSSPRHVEEIMGDRKGTGFAIIGITSGIFNLVVAVVFGALNDRFEWVWLTFLGRRKTSILYGSIMMSISLFLLKKYETIAEYAFAYLFMTFATIIASVPFNGLVYDVTPNEKLGKMSAVMGSMNLLGNLIGALIGAFSGRMSETALNVTLVALLAAGTAITFRYATEQHRPYSRMGNQISIKRQIYELVEPLFIYHDFRMVFVSRFFFQLVIGTFQQFIQYWIADSLKAPEGLQPAEAASIVLIPLLLCSPFSAAILASPLVERLLNNRRKIVVYVSAITMMISCAMCIFTTSFNVAYVISTIFGLGYEFALAMDVLPNKEDTAKDLSLWHSALVLPQIFAMPIAGGIRDIFQTLGKSVNLPSLGYQVIFAICLAYYVIGMYYTSKIRISK